MPGSLARPPHSRQRNNRALDERTRKRWRFPKRRERAASERSAVGICLSAAAKSDVATVARDFGLRGAWHGDHMHEPLKGSRASKWYLTGILPIRLSSLWPAFSAPQGTARHAAPCRRQRTSCNRIFTFDSDCSSVDDLSVTGGAASQEARAAPPVDPDRQLCEVGNAAAAFCCTFRTMYSVRAHPCIHSRI